MKKKPFKISLSIKNMWVYSYTFILLAFTLASGIMFAGYSRSLSSQAMELCSYVSETVSLNIESILTDMRNITSSLTLSPKFNEVLKISDANAYYRSDAVRSTVKSIKDYQGLSNISLIYMYIPDTDTVICGAGIFKSKNFYNVYMDAPAQSYEGWLELLRKGNTPRVYYSAGIKSEFLNKAEDSLISNSYISLGTQKPFVIGIAAPKSIFFKAADGFDWLSRCNVSMVDNGSEFLLLSNKEKSTSDKSDEISVDTLISVDTSVLNITVTAPKKLLLRHIKPFNNILLISLFLFLLLSGGAAYFSIRKNYSPISTVFQRFSLDPTKNTYEHLLMSIEQQDKKYKSIEKSRNKSKGVLKESALRQLLTRSYSACELVQFENYGINFDGKYFCCVIFHIYDVSKLYNERYKISPGQQHRDIRLIMTNVFEEIFSSTTYKGYVTEIDSRFVSLVCLNQSDPSIQHELLRKALKGADIIYSQFGVDMSVAVSKICEGIENAHLTYADAVKTIEHLLLYDLGNGIISDESQSEPSVSGYLFDKETSLRLSESLLTGNSDSAHFIIKDIINRLRTSKEYSLKYAKMVFIDIAGCILRNSDIVSDTALLENIFKINTVSNMEEFLLSVSDEICKSNSSNSSNKQSSLANDIRDYIFENYRHPDLNLAMISNHFGFTASYVSRIFKDEYGESPLDYIHKYRLLKAKELMRTTNLTLSAIANLTGFTHIRTFNRVFKKYENITPSDFKTDISQ